MEVKRIGNEGTVCGMFKEFEKNPRNETKKTLLQYWLWMRNWVVLMFPASMNGGVAENNNNNWEKGKARKKRDSLFL